MAARVAKDKAEEKEKEHEKWWSGAAFMYGPIVGSEGERAHNGYIHYTHSTLLYSTLLN